MISKTIGEGTFGKVKLGLHILTGEKVAVKILEKEKIKDSADVERVSREIKILKIVKHPNIIQLYEIIETLKQFYLIMEYANGGELFEYIVSHGKIKESQACKILQQLLMGLEYLHNNGIAHRDLKPENLLIDQDFNIKIVDFGLSNIFKSGETLKTACGSPCYAAPEMIAGKRYQGPKADIWSTGVVLFALVCGYLPFDDPNTGQLYKKILIGDFKCAKWVSTEARDLLKNILNVNPDERYSIEQIRGHPWISISNFRSMPIIDRKIEEKVFAVMPSFGIDEENARKHLEMRKHNHVTATFYLLAKKILIKSIKIEPFATVPVKETEKKIFSQTNTIISTQRRNSTRKYSVTPSCGATSRNYIKPQEPTMPKPANIPQRLRKK